MDEELVNDGGRVELNHPASPIVALAYHENLNIILVGTQDGIFHVVDPTLRDLVYSTTQKSPFAQSSWSFGIGEDKLIVVSGNLIGIRSEYNGILLLDSILQTQVKSSNSKDPVTLELNKSEAVILCHSLSTLESNNDPEIESVYKQLKSLIGKDSAAEQSSPHLSAKKEKWHTVKLELPHFIIKNTVQTLMTELLKKNRYIPQLSIASSILERLNMLHPPTSSSASANELAGGVPDKLDKTQMFSESARLATFHSWPHTDYKWAKADKMAAAGFYHNPSSANGNTEDRALCFSCSVCLVSWDSQDEPWSEHERHSPFCPFVRGENTHNVPLSLSFATAPASKVLKDGKIGGLNLIGSPILGRSSCPSAAVVGYSQGLFVVWEIVKQAKELVKIEVTPKDIVRASQLSSYCDVALKPKEAWVMDTSETALAGRGTLITDDISQLVKDSLKHNVMIRESVVLSSLALLGFPSTVTTTTTIVPPSVVVGGSLVRGGGDFPTTTTPFVILYDLGTNAVHLSVNNEDPSVVKPSSSSDCDFYTNSGSTGTKQESTTFDEDAFASYISEELMSDSVSIFSDHLNMSDSGGSAFMEFPAIVMSDGTMPPPPPPPHPTAITTTTTSSSSGPAFLSKKKGAVAAAAAASASKKKGSEKGKRDKKDDNNAPSSTATALILQHLVLPEPKDIGIRKKEEDAGALIVQHLLPYCDKLIVILGAAKEKEEDASSSTSSADSSSCCGAIISYKIYTVVTSIRISKEWTALQKLTSRQDLVVEACFVPSDSGDGESSSLLATALFSGEVKLWNQDLGLVSLIKRPGNEIKITTLSYVSSLERLCCGTSSGTLEFYPVNGNATDDIVLEDAAVPTTRITTTLPTIKSSSSNIISLAASKSESSTKLPPAPPLSLDDPSLVVNQNLNLASLKALLALTHFEKASFSANVSSCWLKILQAQKERKHPQHLQHNENENGSTLTWKLQRNKISRNEHIFEINLPKAIRVGHIDLKFLLQSGCVTTAAYLPSIEVTLYRALQQPNNNKSTNNNNNKGTPLSNQTSPTNEFLKSINAEIVVGPLDLGSFVDLSGTGGTVVMTSPTLILRRGRNFYLHIQAKNLGKQTTAAEDEDYCATSSASSSSNSNTDLARKKLNAILANQQEKLAMQKAKYQGLKSAIKSGWGKEAAEFLPSFHPHFGSSLPPHIHKCPETLAGKDYTGCDILNEVSISIFTIRQTPTHPNEDFERKALLTSETVFHRLLKIAKFLEEEQQQEQEHEEKEESCQKQTAALNLLVWIACVNLCGPPVGSMSYQLKFIGAVQEKLEGLVMQGILLSDRSTAHKCTKLLIPCIEASENYHNIEFPKSLLHVLLNLLPYIVSCKSAGSLAWYFLLLNRVRGENLGLASESLLGILKDVSSEIKNRKNPLHSLLRTRFGLYGTPFEPELFDFYPHGVSENKSFSPTTDVDFRDLLVGNPNIINNAKGGNKLLSPKQQIQGLLEVEPLHLTCHAASDGTRIETIDLGVVPTPSSSSGGFSTTLPSSSSPPYDSPFTNLHTGEGSKKSEPEKMEHMMMLQKMDGSDVMFDYIDNLKFMENSSAYKMVELPYSNPDLMAALTGHFPGGGGGGGMLTMVMKGGSGGGPPLISTTHSSGPIIQASNHPHLLSSSSSIYNYPIFQPAQPNLHFTTIGGGAPPPSHTLPLPPPPGPAKSKSTGSSAGSTSKSSKLTATTAEQQQQTKTNITAGASSSSSTGDLQQMMQQMMYVPPQKAIVIDKMHSGARRFVVLDFGAPIRLTDMIIQRSSDLVSLSIDTWLHREDTDGQRLIVTNDIGLRNLVVSDLQPVICRYLKITVIGRYGMGTTKCRIPLGQFYGHTSLLPNDGVAKTHISVLCHVLEDIECRYQIACRKLRLLLEPLLKRSHFSDHINSSSSDQIIISAYQECIILQQQLNVARMKMKRLQKSLTPFSTITTTTNSFQSLAEISTDKISKISEYLIESLLGISFLSASSNVGHSISLYSQMNQDACENFFHNICVLENGQCQLTTSMLLLRVCGFQPWWGKFLANQIKKLFSSGNSGSSCSNNLLFPQDRVFILLVYLGQKSLLSWKNSGKVLEGALELLLEVTQPIQLSKGFLSCKLDYGLLSWVMMYLCKSLDGVVNSTSDTLNNSSGGRKSSSFSNNNKESSSNNCLSYSRRWDFMQGLQTTAGDTNKSQEYSGFRRRIQKQLLKTKEKLDTVAAGMTSSSSSINAQPIGGLNNQLSALGNKIQAIKQKSENLGKNIQNSKHFKDLLQMRRSELIKRSGTSQRDVNNKDASSSSSLHPSSSSDADLNRLLNLDPKLCLQVAKNLGMVLLRMGDSTCHNSDVFLITCKSLARVATACRPTLSLSSIFTSDGLVSLILSAVGSGQKNWSEAWVSHAIFCLIQDILDGERLFNPPSKSEERSKNIETTTNQIKQEEIDSSSNTTLQQEQEQQQQQSQQDGGDNGGMIVMQDDDMIIMDEVDAEMANETNEMTEDNEGGAGQIPMDVCSLSGESDDDSEIDEISIHFGLGSTIHQHQLPASLVDGISKQQQQQQSSLIPLPKKNNNNNSSAGSFSARRLVSCATSTALDARLENGVESTIEVKLRMMAVVDSELLSQSLKGPGSEVLKNASSSSSSNTNNTLQSRRSSSSSEEPSPSPISSSSSILSDCFEKIFQMMASENCSISIEKVLQLWISINFSSGCGGGIKPIIVVPLSTASISSLMMAFTKNSGIGVQEWGLAFQCLGIVLNQRNLLEPQGQMWLHIMRDKCFPEMILKFISGSGMHQKNNHIVSAGPTVCQHFYNFLLRLRQSADTPVWTCCLKEILLRVLSVFLSGPFITTDFPIDAFNSFLDRLTCPDLTYMNLTTVISIMEQIAQILHQYIFCPNKLKLKPGNEIKSLHSTSNNTGDTIKPQTFEKVIFRLVSFMASFVGLPYKTSLSPEKMVQECLSQLPKSFQLADYENALADYVVKCGENNMQPKTIADIVLQMESTMLKIMSVLAHPNNINVLESGDSQLMSAYNIMETSVPTTVVDTVIHLFCKIQTSATQSSWLIEPIFQFIAKSPYDDFCCPFIVSETFVLMVLKLIEQVEEIPNPMVEAICHKFVGSSKRFLCSSPTIVSILTQYIGRTDSNAIFGIGSSSKKLNNEGSLIEDGQINVAPLGTITSTNFSSASAQFPEVLLQSQPPHRRARSPLWSYHFLPEEDFLEIVITLPCAVLLNQVVVVPHMTSLTTCPSAIMVEVSRDQQQSTTQTTPIGPPLTCSGMSNIIIQLIQPEVVKTVLLRLFKPKYSNNVGLQQIKLLATTTFSTMDNDNKSFESSAHWLYILDRAIKVSESKSGSSSSSDGTLCHRRIIETAVNIPDVLESCYSMFIIGNDNNNNGNKDDIYLSHVASVLFQFGNLRQDISKQVMDALLGPVHMGFTHGMVETNRGIRVVVELLYKLCCDIPQWGLSNLMVMVAWLEKNCTDDNPMNEVKCSIAAPAYLQAIASSIWQIASIGKNDLSQICTPKLVWKLYKWSLKLEENGKSDELDVKISLDHVLCSMCYAKPYLFVYLLTKMGILKQMDWTLEEESSDNHQTPIEERIYQWYEEECIWDRLQLVEDLSFITSSTLSSRSKLLTLGRVSQSPMASKILVASGLLPLLNSAIISFWSYYTYKWSHPSLLIEEQQQQQSQNSLIISTKVLISILSFYTELCTINDLKTWFGESGSGFWLPILNLLSSLPSSLKASFFGGSTNVYELESVLIQFLSKCCWSHPGNQKIIATCLREIIHSLKSQKSSPHNAFLHSMSSFCRRLLIQLLLENERVVVHIKSSGSNNKYPLKSPLNNNTLQLQDKHPSMGVNIGDRLFYMNTHANICDLLQIIEPPGIKLEKLADSSEPNIFLSLLRKEQGLAEMAMKSGNAAKDKRMPPNTTTTTTSSSEDTTKSRTIKMASKKLKPEGATAAVDYKFNGDGDDKEKGSTTRILELEEFPGVSIPTSMSIATLMAAVRVHRPDVFLDSLVFSIRTKVLGGSSSSSRTQQQQQQQQPIPGRSLLLTDSALDELAEIPGVFCVDRISTTIEVFSAAGGLGLLAPHLPIVYPETLRQSFSGGSATGMNNSSNMMMMMIDKDSPAGMSSTIGENDWVKIEAAAGGAADDFYDEMLDSMVSSTPLAKRNPASLLCSRNFSPGIPPHALAAFGLFLSLPRFSDILLGERVGAQLMLRLVMGCSDDADGMDILGNSAVKILPTLPFEVLRCLLDVLPVGDDFGLRKTMVDLHATHFILSCLAIFTHQPCGDLLPGGLQHDLVLAATKAQSGYSGDGKSGVNNNTTGGTSTTNHYWAKGTGFGTGSTAQNWDIEMAIQKKKTEEDNVTCLLRLMSSYINPKISRTTISTSFLTAAAPGDDGGQSSTSQQLPQSAPLPDVVIDLLRSSSLFVAIAGYLRNDSVLDMARHVPLYTAVCEFLRSLVSSAQLLPLLWERKAAKTGSSGESDECISSLITKMKDVVDNYSKRLTNLKGKGKNKSSAIVKMIDMDDEGLAVLIPDIQMTAKAVAELAEKRNPEDIEMAEDASLQLALPTTSLEERYILEMKKLQFAFYEMIAEEEEGGGSTSTAGIRFVVPYHYESIVRTSWSRGSSASRLKRLAQESVTLSTSLPIAHGSTIFVRCDNDRLDVMKVLITGPSATPYANGCFEFDVWFPMDYPQNPMMINLETNGRQRVRFNPNLYTDGKVCLSILNTWHGRPEEKWSPQTGSLLPVLVAIQSLILNSEPYFNEPGYEKSRGTEQGERNNREYNCGIKIATVEWAMLDQLRHPSPCFKDIIQRHFWMKRGEILAQLDEWMEEITETCRNDKRAGKSVTGCADPVAVYKNNFNQLKKEFMNMACPPGLEDLSDIEGQLTTTTVQTPPSPSSSSCFVPTQEKASATVVSPPPTTDAAPTTSESQNIEGKKKEGDDNHAKQEEEDEKMSVDV